jgi:hypothetical protein
MTRTTIAKQANKAGTVFALVKGEAFEVWRLCSNYDGRVADGVQRTWRYVEKDMTEAAARALFARRLSGTQQ